MDVLVVFTARTALRKVGTKEDYAPSYTLTRARKHKCRMSGRAKLEGERKKKKEKKNNRHV